jgi:C-terminal processing protease CtpA/Prc
MKKNLLVFLGIGILLVACNKNDDDLSPNPTADVTVQDFMWKAMNLWYFWQDNVPNLADSKFTSDEEYTTFLQATPNPEDFFFDQLLFNDDRFSFLNEDYKELTENLSGISRSNGLEFGLFLFADSDDIFGYVRYIIANSDASTKDISRGELFTGVDGQTLNRNNYRDLLFGESATYTLNMADIDNGVITPNGKEVELTKEEGLVENPVFITKTFDISGQKIGYLMYNGFTNEFDEELNDAFGQLKSGAITDLVLDMRYNSGGSVNSSRLLSSMIYGTNTAQLYIRQRWNPKIQEAFSAEDLEDYFADVTGQGSAINTLNLDRVYVLTTNSTASASELVINGLDPYVDVIKIGTTTTGKNEFSLTMVDDSDREGAPYIYTPSRENQINPDNSWAIQPLVGRNENSVGFSDYTDGFMPDIELDEDLENMGVLGDMNEPMLARAIFEITGVSTKRGFDVKTPVRLHTSSKMFQPIKDNMVLDKPFQINMK